MGQPGLTEETSNSSAQVHIQSFYYTMFGKIQLFIRDYHEIEKQTSLSIFDKDDHKLHYF
jgi:hypothetical protein